MTPTEIVEAFIEGWNQMDWDTVVDLLAEDVIYHNIPMEKLEGKAAAEAVIRGMQAVAVDWITLNIAANGSVVLTERLDNFKMSLARMFLSRSWALSRLKMAKSKPGAITLT
jgi:limonene-1,2-epoxide hydrolase